MTTNERPKKVEMKKEKNPFHVPCRRCGKSIGITKLFHTGRAYCAECIERALLQTIDRIDPDTHNRIETISEEGEG